LITLGSTSFFHIKEDNLYLVAVTKSNPNAALVFEFLYKIVNLFKSYFPIVTEDSVKSNFVLIYELIDEICDFGYPQLTEESALKQYITTEGVKAMGETETAEKIAIQTTGAVSWRQPGIKYRKNEAFSKCLMTYKK
jgi:AP-2 complex subunit mu-1